MGTTQRIGTGVKNEPNWGDLNTSITSIAKAVEEILKDEKKKEQKAELDEKTKQKESDEKKVEEKEKLAKDTASKDAKTYKRLVDRRDVHVKSVFDRLVKIGGGSKSISSGQSKVMGRAGLKSAGKLVSFISDVQQKGWDETLKSIVIGNVAGKTVEEVLDHLKIYCGDSSVGMDEIAANNALCEVLKELGEEAGDNYDDFKSLIESYTEDNKLYDLMTRYFGYYIFEYLSERLEEKISQTRGEDVSSETFKQIKEYIMGRVYRVNKQRSVSEIDWHGNEGKNEIEKIFESVIKIEA
jgi:hypothetical protein